MPEQKSVDELVDDLLADMPTNAEVEIELPSRKKAVIRPMTFEEERQMVAVSKKQQDPSFVLLSHCVKDIELSELLIIDKIYLLFKIRELSFGSVYKFIMGCPQCGHENHYSIDIDKLPVNRLEEETDFVEMILPMSKKKVKLRLATLKEEEYATDPEKALDNLWRFVLKFEDTDRKDVISKVIRKLPAGDINSMLGKILCEGYGISSEVRVKCDACTYDQPTMLPFTKDFFSVT